MRCSPWPMVACQREGVRWRFVWWRDNGSWWKKKKEFGILENRKSVWLGKEGREIRKRKKEKKL